MQGQANHFVRYAAEHIEYAVTRYQNEVKRLYGVLDKHLKDANTDYLVGSKCTIADIVSKPIGRPVGFTLRLCVVYTW